MSTTKKELNYKVGDKTLSGETISFIYGSSNSLIVFKDSNGLVQFETTGDELSPTELAVHAYYDALESRVRSYLPKDKHQRFITTMAQALFLALSETDKKAALSHFDSIAGALTQEVQIIGRFQYVLWGTCAGTAAVAAGLIVALCPSDVVKDIGRAFAIGAGGAWFSVIQRASRLELGPFEAPRHLIIQGITRILLGVAFGMVTITAIKAGVLLPNATNQWLIGLTIFIGGMSERLVPELITRVENRTAAASIAQKASGTIA